MKISASILWVLLLACAFRAQAAALVPLAGGMQMTGQFVNNTCGIPDSQIYILVMANNAAGQICYLTANGTLVPISAGDNASNHSIPLSALTSGMQIPPFAVSGRIYVSYNTPMNMPFISAGGGVGLVQANINNPSDPNINTTFDWVEFSVVSNQAWFNTTQVDFFAIPMKLDLYTGSSTSYSLNGSAGITETATAIAAEWAATVPAPFQGLAGPHRILAPIHGSFGAGGADAAYFNAYINSIWAQYSSSNLVLGAYTGHVDGSGRMAFTKPGDGTTYYVNKPTSQDVFGGSGALASGNATELALEAQITAAFHRHVLDNAALIDSPSSYYQTAATDYYSQFWHEHSLGGLAYGFAYDDVNEQSTTLSATNPRGINLTIGGGCDTTPTMTVTRTRTATATPSRTVTPTSTDTRSSTASPTASVTPTRTMTRTPSRTATSSPSPSRTASVSSTRTATQSSTSTDTVTPTRSATASSTRTALPSSTPTLSGTSTRSPEASKTVTPTRTATSSVTCSATVTPSSTVTPTLSSSATGTSSATASVTAQATRTASASATPSGTPSPGSTPTSTSVAGLSPVASSSPTLQATPEPSPSFFQQEDLLVERGLYPNPFSESLNVFFSLRVDSTVTMSLYNVAGEPLWQTQVAGKAGKNVVPWAGINAAGARCASGVYVLRVSAHGIDGSNDGFWDRAVAVR